MLRPLQPPPLELSLEGDDSESGNGSSMEVIVRLGERFQIPLESAGVDVRYV